MSNEALQFGLFIFVYILGSIFVWFVLLELLSRFVVWLMFDEDGRFDNYE